MSKPTRSRSVQKTTVKKTSKLDPKNSKLESSASSEPRVEGDINIELKNKISNKCRHVMHYWQNNGVYNCIDACDYINNQIAEGHKFSDDALSDFFRFLQQTRGDNYYYYYERERCIYKEGVRIANTLSLIFNTHDLNSDTVFISLHTLLGSIVKLTNYDECFKVLFDAGYDFTEVLDKLLEARFIHSKDKTEDANLANTVMSIIDRVPMSPEVVFKIIKCRHTGICNKIAGIIDKYCGDLTSQHLVEACKIMPYSRQVVSSLLDRKIELTRGDLNLVSKYCDAESLDYFLSLTRMPVYQDHYHAVVHSKSYVGDESEHPGYYYYRRRIQSAVDKDGYENIAKQEIVGPKIEVLIKYGYKPTYDDVVYGIKCKVEIPGIERFDIKLDRTLLELCWDYDFYPTGYKFDCIDPMMIELQKACSTRAKVNINKIIKKGSLTPDRKCMENACNFANNAQIVDVLVDKGGPVTYKCLKNCAGQLKNNMMLMKIMDLYEKNQKAEIEKYKAQIADLEEAIEQGGVKKVAKVKEDEKQAKEQKDVTASTKKEGQVELIELDDLDEALVDEIDKSSQIVAIDEAKLSKIPKQKRRKVNIPKKYATCFNLTATDKKKKMSYMDLKKELIDRIRSNKWYAEDDQQLIKLPEDLCNTLGLDKGYIKFTEIDKLVGVFYS